MGGQGPARGLGDLRVGVLEKRNTPLFHPDASTVWPGLVPPALKHKLFRNFPGELASSEMAVACRLLVDGLLQIQVPACSAEKKVISNGKRAEFLPPNLGTGAIKRLRQSVWVVLPTREQLTPRKCSVSAVPRLMR